MWGLYYAKSTYDQGIRDDERTVCNADWTEKNQAAQEEFDKQINTIKQKQKVIRPAPDKQHFNDELLSGKAFNPYGSQI